ncbi:uncharacterized protein LOC121371396 isoform X1 [Gigantopelta aegis]|uniref:uncharacterized protein LOC121371396 isoform X1 n=1 Tax=Gigantopelta aegis TaxID=1735272 RepID=UPI001B88E486|nr:uncharacterized protein LOC121371396 isoform X1 [Gigantopelta aegis]
MKRKCLELSDKSNANLTSVDSGIDLDLCSTFPYHHRDQKRRRRETRKETCNIFSDSFNLDQFYTCDFSTRSKQNSSCSVHDDSTLVVSSPRDTNCSIQASLDSLRSNLIELGMTPSRRFENSMRQRFRMVSEKDSIRMKISLNLKAEEKSELQRKEEVLCRVSEALSTPHKNRVDVSSHNTDSSSKARKGKSTTSIFRWFRSTRKSRQNVPRRNFKKYRVSDTETDDAIRPTLFCMF